MRAFELRISFAVIYYWFFIGFFFFHINMLTVKSGVSDFIKHTRRATLNVADRCRRTPIAKKKKKLIDRNRRKKQKDHDDEHTPVCGGVPIENHYFITYAEYVMIVYNSIESKKKKKTRVSPGFLQVFTPRDDRIDNDSVVLLYFFPNRVAEATRKTTKTKEKLRF